MAIFVETLDHVWVNLQHVVVAVPTPGDYYVLRSIDGLDLGTVPKSDFDYARVTQELACLGKS